MNECIECSKSVRYSEDVVESPIGLFCSNKCYGKNILPDEEYQQIYKGCLDSSEDHY